MQWDHGAQKPHAFLDLTDFHVLLSALGAYLHYMRLLNQESASYQDLYTKVDIAVATMNAGNIETINLSHEELSLLLTALMKVDTALALQGTEGKTFLERSRLLISENVARVQEILWGTLLQANGGKKAQHLH
jgi:hypothetical protein